MRLEKRWIYLREREVRLSSTFSKLRNVSGTERRALVRELLPEHAVRRRVWAEGARDEPLRCVR
mgnify:CR=1 FL=1